MKTLALIIVFMTSNVVGAGVWFVLYMGLDRAMPGEHSLLILMAFGVVSVACALFFIEGAVRSLARLQFPKRRGGARL